MATLGDTVLSYSTAKRWPSLFKVSRETVEDDPQSGRPSAAVTEESVDLTESFVMEDRRISVRRIAAEVHLSVGSVDTILHNHLRLSKLSA